MICGRSACWLSLMMVCVRLSMGCLCCVAMRASTSLRVRLLRFMTRCMRVSRSASTSHIWCSVLSMCAWCSMALSRNVMCDFCCVTHCA